MAALTPTNVIGARGRSSEFAGDYKLQVLTVVPTTASDTITLVRATDKMGTILGVFAEMAGGADADLQSTQVTFTGLVITLATFNGAGAAATDWTSAVVRLLVIGTDA